MMLNTLPRYIEGCYRTTQKDVGKYADFSCGVPSFDIVRWIRFGDSNVLRFFYCF